MTPCLFLALSLLSRRSYIFFDCFKDCDVCLMMMMMMLMLCERSSVIGLGRLCVVL